MEQLAIIDLGTNTFNLLIVQPKANQDYEIVFSDKVAVKLGEGGITKNFISPEPFQRGLDAIRQHLNTCAKYKVEKVFAFGTSAIRSALNGPSFTAAIKEQFDLEVSVISGETEAEYIYLGVNQALDFNTENSLIMDIGGGSTEFIICNKQEVLWKESFKLGVFRILETLNPSDPLTDDDITRLCEHTDQLLTPLYHALEQYPVRELIGSSGSFDSFAEMIAGHIDEFEILNGKTNYTFNLEEFEAQHQRLLPTTSEERYQIKGLVPMRVDTIVLASVFVMHLLRKLNLQQMRLSTYALKEGVVSLLLKGGL